MSVRVRRPQPRRTSSRVLPALLSTLLAACGGGGDSSGSATATSTQLAQIAAVSATTTCAPFQTAPVFAGSVPTPESVLGFALGTQEVTSEQIGQYLAALDQASARVVTGIAATSVQGRPLPYAIVGREENLTADGLDRLKKAVARLLDPDTPPATAAALAATTPAILWISGNVHGNEESGADAALRVAYELADRSDCVAARIRDNAVVVILPTQNPDGREADTRRNAYGFDMNRDWFARTQPETDGKLELLRQYPPVLLIDAHEMGSNRYFFPPNADPTYHEVPEQTFNWINNLYGASISAEFDRQKIAYFHGAPYDLFAAEYGDTVPVLAYHTAGMTFEKYNGAPIATRTYEHFVAMMTSLFAGASNRAQILADWHTSRVDARNEGANGVLEPNGIYYDGKKLYQAVPDRTIRHYFLRDDPARSREIARLVRRLQRMDVQVWRLDAPLAVADYRAYGTPPATATLPAGTYWIPMAQAQKHWVQAMLHEDSYVPVTVSYDVSAWSNPLLMNIAGGSSGLALSPQATRLSPVADPLPPGPPANALRIGLFAIPGNSGTEAAGAMRYLFDKVWGVPYTEVSADQIRAGLTGIDVLLVPDGYANGGLQALGNKGQKALAAWVEAGGRFVGYVGGAELAIASGVSTAVLQTSNATVPGTLLRISLDPASPLTDGIARVGESRPTAWVMYMDNDRMSLGLGSVAASYPAPSDSDYGTSGLAIGVDELAGTAAIIDEPVGAGRSIVFAFDPNFRGWSDGTQRLLWNALFGTNPSVAAPTAKLRSAAIDAATRAVKALPDVGKPIRIVVQTTDADVVRGLLVSFGADFKETHKAGRTRFVIANRDALGWEEHPFALELTRQLAALVTPISVSVP